jgi:hypothetical protein
VAKRSFSDCKSVLKPQDIYVTSEFSPVLALEELWSIITKPDKALQLTAGSCGYCILTPNLELGPTILESLIPGRIQEGTILNEKYIWIIPCYQSYPNNVGEREIKIAML